MAANIDALVEPELGEVGDVVKSAEPRPHCQPRPLMSCIAGTPAAPKLAVDYRRCKASPPFCLEFTLELWLFHIFFPPSKFLKIHFVGQCLL